MPGVRPWRESRHPKAPSARSLTRDSTRAQTSATFKALLGAPWSPTPLDPQTLLSLAAGAAGAAESAAASSARTGEAEATLSSRPSATPPLVGGTVGKCFGSAHVYACLCLGFRVGLILATGRPSPESMLCTAVGGMNR